MIPYIKEGSARVISEWLRITAIKYETDLTVNEVIRVSYLGARLDHMFYVQYEDPLDKNMRIGFLVENRIKLWGTTWNAYSIDNLKRCIELCYETEKYIEIDYHPVKYLKVAPITFGGDTGRVSDLSFSEPDSDLIDSISMRVKAAESLMARATGVYSPSPEIEAKLDSSIESLAKSFDITLKDELIPKPLFGKKK